MVGRAGEHDRYVDALLRELELERGVLADALETIFLGGGTRRSSLAMRWLGCSRYFLARPR